VDVNSGFRIGDLVMYKSWYEGNHGWVSDIKMFGIVLEIHEICSDFSSYVYYGDEEIIYDVKVYWFEDEKTEILPDLLLVPMYNPLGVSNG